MTALKSAERAAERTATPRLPDHIDHESLYVALVKMHRVVTRVLVDVEKNSTELHRHLDHLAAARDEAADLLYPPPPPEAPADAIVLYAHAVRPKDRLHLRGEWVTVRGYAPVMDKGVPGVVLEFEHSFPRHSFVADEVLAVIRAPENVTPPGGEE